MKKGRRIHETSENEVMANGEAKRAGKPLRTVLTALALIAVAAALLVFSGGRFRRSEPFIVGGEEISAEAIGKAADGKFIRSLAVKNDLKRYAELDAYITGLMNNFSGEIAAGQNNKRTAQNIKNALESSGLVKKNSCEADENGNAVVFRYPDGTEGIIFLTRFSADECGEGGEVTKANLFAGGNMLLADGKSDEAPKILLLSAYTESVSLEQPEAFNASGEVTVGRYVNTFDAYHKQYIESLPVNLTVERSAEVKDFLSLGAWDAVIIGAHGATINGECCICLEEKADTAKDLEYYKYIKSGGVMRSFDSAGKSYLIRKELFSKGCCGNLSDTFIFVECCGFFGKDSISKTPDTSFADAMIAAGAAGVAGFHNSVLNEYAISLFGDTLNRMCGGSGFTSAIEEAMNILGEDDGSRKLTGGNAGYAAASPCYVLAGEDFSF